VVTKSLVPLLALAALLAGCGRGEDAEAKQAALAPADPEAEETVAKPAAKPPVHPAAKHDSAAVAAAPATTSDSTPENQNGDLGRESFSYTGGSRDPFVSLLATATVGPELPDLILVAIYYDTRVPANSVVVMREKVGGKKFNLRTGDRLGRIQVAGVRPKDVTFTIDDFGTERQETMSLRKQEEIK